MARINTKSDLKIPLISIIIPHHQGFEILYNCIDSIYKSNYKNYQIIIVDNHTTDNSIKKVKEKFSEVEVLKLDKNIGYAGGCNHGANKAEGEFLLFLNNDTIHDPNWIEPLINKLINNSNLGSVQPKILNLYDTKKFDYAGASGGLLDIFCFPFTRGRIFDNIEKDEQQYDNEKKIFWSSGCAFLTRKEIFLKISFDDRLFAYMEEIDYHWKMKLQGYESLVVPESIVYHSGGTLNNRNFIKSYYNHRNSMVIFLTNHSLFTLSGLLIPKLILEVISLTRYIMKLDIKAFFAQLSAYIWLLTHPIYLIKRIIHIKKIKKESRISIIRHMYRPSIVFDYFILNKKRYKDLVD